MKDRYGREIDYLRISITDRCNLRCIYCMPEEGICQISHGEILTYDEIQRVCRCMTTLGIKKIKLTGGEPLTRKNSAALVRMLKELPGIEKVTLTTNGVLLGEQISELAEAGIDNINISLDTLNEEAFGKITRREGLPKVLESMKEALKYPEFTEITQLGSYTTSYKYSDGSDASVVLTATDHYLTGEATAPKGITILGGKTGTTSSAGNCLALLCQNEYGNPFVSIVMGASTKELLYQEMTSLLEHINTV